MMSIAILYEQPDSDEMGIKLTAQQMGIDLAFIPFRKVSIFLDRGRYALRSMAKDYSEVIQRTSVVLNRTQSKNRRLYAASILDALDKHVINSSSIEYICFSKLRSILRFWKAGINVPRTVFVPCNTHEYAAGTIVHNEEVIASLIQQGLGGGHIVIKPDAGTHGKSVVLAKDRNDLLTFLKNREPSTNSPVGIFAQEFVNKWFYDLRIIVSKEKGKQPYCYPSALARAGWKDFRTNTYLGNMVFKVNLPEEVRRVAIRCGLAIAMADQSWVLALDAMPNVAQTEVTDDDYIRSKLEKLEPSFERVREVKRDETKRVDFSRWNERLEDAFSEYTSTEAYHCVSKIIEENVWKVKESILFHEANACPEFWEQTRLVAGINLAVPLLECAQSLVDSHS